MLLFLRGLGFLYKKLQTKNSIITQQKEALNTANKTKDYLFSVVSHDLHSSINTIKRLLQVIKGNVLNNNVSEIEETTNNAILVTESTSHLLNNVLHLSLEQSDQMLFNLQKKIALRPTVEHVLYDYKILVQANNAVITSEIKMP